MIICWDVGDFLRMFLMMVFALFKLSKNYHPVHPLILVILILTDRIFRYRTSFINLLISQINYLRSRVSLLNVYYLHDSIYRMKSILTPYLHLHNIKMIVISPYL